jgi:DNA-binding IclR family transcriptional regulator
MQRSSACVSRVARILDFVAGRHGRACTLTDLVRALQISHATCHALLNALIEVGYLHRTRERTYVLGPSLIGIGRGFTDAERATDYTLPTAGDANSRTASRWRADAMSVHFRSSD